MPGKKIKNVNEVRLVGYTGKDAEVSYTASGTARAKFSLATSASWKDKEGEWQQSTQWHNIIAWGELAEQCTDIRKGSPLQVTGRIDYQSWDDRKTGEKKYMTQIVADTIEELGEKRDEREDDDRWPRRNERRDDRRSDSRASRPAPRGSSAPKRDSRERRDDRPSNEITDEDIPF